MKFKRVCLEAFGYVLPGCVVTSLDLERRLKAAYDRFSLHEGRLELMSGIRERRFWNRGTLPSEASSRAGAEALAASNTSPDEIECLFHTAVSKDFLEPATASVVHHNLKLSPKTILHDISNACLGFANGMINLANMIELGQVKKGLVVAGESSRQLVESTIDSLLANPNLTKKQVKAAFASLTIGSGAVGLVMAHESVSETGHRLVGGAARAATIHNNLCQGSADTGFGDGAKMLMNTDSEMLLVEGCQLARETWDDFKSELDWTNGDVGRVFTHQVGIAHRDRLYEAIGLDVANDFATLKTLGNVGSVSLPITAAMGVEHDPPAPGEKIAMLGIGSGLNCVMLGIEW